MKSDRRTVGAANVADKQAESCAQRYHGISKKVDIPAYVNRLYPYSETVRRLLLLLPLCFSCTAMADWVEYATKPNGDIFFYDDRRVEKNGSQLNVWTRVRYKTSVMAASSYQSLVKLDCAEHSEIVLQHTFYTDRDWNTPAMATNMNAKPKTWIKPNSVTAQLVSILCKQSQG